MKTVRFTRVVAECGKPEVYLLFAKDDPVFAKALRTNRVMTVVEKGSKPSSAILGVDDKSHGQLLVFPKSLKRFEGSHIIGIKAELFAPPVEQQEKPEKVLAKPARTPKPVKPSKPPKVAPAKIKPEVRPKALPAPKANVIAFPKEKLTPEEARTEKLKAVVRKALDAVERGRLDQARQLLTRLLKTK